MPHRLRGGGTRVSQKLGTAHRNGEVYTIMREQMKESSCERSVEQRKDSGKSVTLRSHPLAHVARQNTSRLFVVLLLLARL